MATAERRTTLERASAEYDAEFEDGLVVEITRAIVDASKVTDTAAIVMRLHETTSALLTCLATVMAMSPSVTGSRTVQRQFLRELDKTLRQRMAAAEHSPELHDLLRQAFHGTATNGTA
jgi:hypothetical protein